MRSHSVALTKLKSPEDSQPEGLGAEQTRIPGAARNCTHCHHLQKPPKIWECELHELTRLSQLDFTPMARLAPSPTAPGWSESIHHSAAASAWRWPGHPGLPPWRQWKTPLCKWSIYLYCMHKESRRWWRTYLLIYISLPLSLSLSLSLYLHPRIAYVYTFIGRIICVGEYTMYACMSVQQRWSGCWPQPARLQQQVWEACKMLHSRCSDVFSEVEPILSGLKKQSKTIKNIPSGKLT